MNAELGLGVQPGRHYVFRDQSLWIAELDGEIRGDTLDGAYYANTRLLSRFALRLNGHPLSPVQVAPARDDLLVAYYHDPRITADFADLEEPRAGNRLQKAPVQRVCTLEDTGELRFVYGHPDLHEAAVLHCSSPPQCHDGGVRWALTLSPRADWHACLEVTPVHQGATISPVARCYGAIAPDDADDMPAWRERATRIETSNDSVRRGYERAVADLEALALRDGPPLERASFAAGVPYYHNPFGRDLLTTSWQALLAMPALLHSAILTCARHQGAATDDFRDEQPGRIIQQVRTGPLNLLNINPRGRYYSDYASPGDFLIMLGQHLMWTGDRDVVRAHLPGAERVLGWLDREADLDGDGFYEYQTRSPLGDRNQGWKDSEHAILDTDGNDPPLPIATCEVQGYVYAGKQQLGAALLALGRVRDGTRLLREAGELKRRFNRAFWMPNEGFVALALDGQKRQVRSIASNAAHCLATGIVDAAHVPAVAGRLMAPDMFSGWGIRTLSADHIAYNPFSYHLGSVWPVEQATAAFGFKRYGFGMHTNAIAQATFDLAERYERHRLPEAIGGLPRDRRHPFPGVYPKSCRPQAWSAGAIIMMLQAILGLRPLAPLGLLLVYPELPEWLPDVTLRGLRIGRSTLTIDFRRRPDGTTDFRVRERHGHVRVLRAPPESSVRHGLLPRVIDPLVTIMAGRD